MAIPLKSIMFASASFVLIGGFQAHSAPVTFFGENLSPGGTVSGDPVTARTNFLSNLTGVSTEGFEGLTDGTDGPTVTFAGSAGDINATFSSGAEVEDDAGAGRFATSGSTWIDTPSASSFDISFDTAISAFGFYGTDIGDFDNELILTLGNGTTEVLNVGNSTGDVADGALLFFGFYDTENTYTNIQFSNTGGVSDVFGFDDMVVGDLQQVTPSPVPVPGAVPLMLTAVAGFGLLRARRKS